MDEYINREELLKDIEDSVRFSTRNGVSAELRGAHKIVDRIRSAPACDVVEVVHSKWILYTDGSGECERCHRRQKNVWDFENWQNFCGHCGAKMDGERRSENENT